MTTTHRKLKPEDVVANVVKMLKAYEDAGREPPLTLHISAEAMDCLCDARDKNRLPSSVMWTRSSGFRYYGYELKT